MDLKANFPFLFVFARCGCEYIQCPLCLYVGKKIKGLNRFRIVQTRKDLTPSRRVSRFVCLQVNAST